MAGFLIDGITATAEGNLPVVTPNVLTEAGYVVAVDEIDAGVATGTKLRRAGHTTLVRLRRSVGTDTMLFDDAFNSTAQNTGTWRFIFSTLTATMSAGSLLLNSGSTTTTTTGCQLTTWRQFNLRASGGLEVESVGGPTTAAPLTNQVVEFGLFPFGTGTAAPTEGIFFRWTSAGLIGVINYNTVETPTAAFTASFSANQMYRFSIRIDQRGIEFYRDGILLGTLAIPAANGFPFMWNALPWSYQFRNAGTVSGAPHMQWKAAATSIEQNDLHTAKPWSHQLAMMGLNYQGMNGGTMGSLALYTNNLAAGAGAAMTNTTAALGTGLGGQFTALPTLTAATDGILCSYQNPVGGINQTPRTLVVTGVRIQGLVTTAFTGGPVYYAYSVAYGHTAASMATGEGASFSTATTKAPRRIPIGFETYVVTAPVGTVGLGVLMKFDCPIVVNPGEFFAICAKNLGTVTTLGAICLLVTVDHYWE